MRTANPGVWAGTDTVHLLKRDGAVISVDPAGDGQG